MTRRTSTRMIRLACVAVVAAAALGACFVMAGRVPAMQSPLAVTDAALESDGGSAWVLVTDANGRKLAFGVEGSLRRDPRDFPVYVQRWYPVPVWVHVDRQSDAGRALLEIVERTGRDGGTLATQAVAGTRVALLGRHE